jgi:bifunctional DNA-binding transcriptional regulator/antitoxin component of YhaV-PrlF toxin-antitoxin module
LSLPSRESERKSDDAWQRNDVRGSGGWSAARRESQLPAIVLLVKRQVKRRRGFTHLSPKRQITLPVSVVERAGLTIGEELAVEADDEGRVIVSRSGGETVGDRRRRALDRAAGALPDVWPTGALDELRDEWR